MYALEFGDYKYVGSLLLGCSRGGDAIYIVSVFLRSLFNDNGREEFSWEII
jgi:hypothetical protein